MRTYLALLATILLTGCINNPIACLLGNSYVFEPSRSHWSTTALVQEDGPIRLRASRGVEVGYGCDEYQRGRQEPAKLEVQRNETTAGKVLLDWSTGGYYYLELQDELSAGDYRYTVTALDPQAASLGTVHFPIQLQPPGVSAPTLTVGDPTSLATKLTWTPTNGHSGYEVVFAYDAIVDNRPDLTRSSYSEYLPETATSFDMSQATESLTMVAVGMGDTPPEKALADLKNLTVTVLATTWTTDSHGNEIKWQFPSNEVPLNLKP